MDRTSVVIAAIVGVVVSGAPRAVADGTCRREVVRTRGYYESADGQELLRFKPGGRVVHCRRLSRAQCRRVQHTVQHQSWVGPYERAADGTVRMLLGSGDEAGHYDASCRATPSSCGTRLHVRCRFIESRGVRRGTTDGYEDLYTWRP